ncbi:UbiA family prenyltransferase [Candidatus Marsarchaeota archaeon]|nr:UbiA family prenyltransferase [Candidatus Marsarchaeota archaeon]
MSKIWALFRLTRIEHSAMLVIAVIAAELISGPLPSFPILLLSLITPIFVSMGSFAINDYFDVESDKSNKRFDRPLVNGELSMRSALSISIISFVIGVGAGAFINAYAFAIALIFGALAFLYSYRLKDMLLLGNIYIALSMAIPFLYGDFVVSSMLSKGIAVVFFIVFLSGLAREIHGMIRDYRGDAKARRTRNLVHRIGSLRSAQLAFLLYAEAILISIFAFFFIAPFMFNLSYILPIGIADAMLAYVAILALFRGSHSFYKSARNISLLAMGVALLGYLVSPLLHFIV